MLSLKQKPKLGRRKPSTGPHAAHVPWVRRSWVRRKFTRNQNIFCIFSLQHQVALSRSVSWMTWNLALDQSKYQLSVTINKQHKYSTWSLPNEN